MKNVKNELKGITKFLEKCKYRHIKITTLIDKLKLIHVFKMITETIFDHINKILHAINYFNKITLVFFLSII
jgi:hypothetical protein